MKEKIKQIILWIVSIFFILTFMVFVNQIIIPSTLLLICGIVLLPPINNKIKEKICNEDNIKKYKVARNILVIIFIYIFCVYIPVQDSNLINNAEKSDNSSSIQAISNSIKEIDKNKIDESISKTMTETNGEYTGERVDGKKQGKGKYVWKDGSTYEGEFLDDKINGQGKLTITEKGTYEGTFSNDKKSGKGTYKFINGDKYEGNWEDDKMSGMGTYTFTNGDTYVGEFSDNKFNGQGTYTKGSNKYTGTWSNNEYKK